MDSDLEEEWQIALLTMTPEEFEAFWQWIMNDSEDVPLSTSSE